MESVNFEEYFIFDAVNGHDILFLVDFDFYCIIFSICFQFTIT